MTHFVLVFLAPFLVVGCKVSSKSQLDSSERAKGEFSSVNADVDRIPDLLKGQGISMPSLAQMEDSPEDHTSLSFQNALVSAWLSSLVYGSANQIASQLLQAGVIDGNVAEVAIRNAKLIQLFRILSDSFAGNGALSAGKYMKQATSMARVDFGIKALPALYKLALKEINYSLDSDLLAEWSKARDGREVNRIVGEEAKFYLDLLRSADPESFLKNQKSRSVQSERFELIFRGLTSALVNLGRKSIPVKVVNQELAPFIQKVRDRISEDPMMASKSFSQIAELLEYQLASEDYLRASGPAQSGQADSLADAPSSGLLLFSGGRLQTDKADLFQEGSTQLLVLEHRNNKDVFFVFRGTTNYKDWFLNLNPGLSKDPIDGQGQMHEGFIKAYGELTLPRVPIEFDVPEVIPQGKSRADLVKESQAWQQKYSLFRPVLSNVLNRAKVNQKRIWIAGHSLGGAMALIFLKKILTFPEYRELVAGVYTIGAPRIGDNAFSEKFDFMKRSMVARVVRFRYEKDIVALLNPGNQFGPDSQTVQLTNKKSCLIQDRLLQLFKSDQGAWFHRNMGNCSLISVKEESFPAVKEIISTGRLAEGVADHSFFNYIESLGFLKNNQK